MARDLRIKRPRASRDLGDYLPPPGTQTSPFAVPEAGMYQNPGTFGINDMYLGQFYESNPEYFGSDAGNYWQSEFSDLNSIYQSYWWQNQLNEGIINEDFGSEQGGIDWDMAEAAYNWWNAFGPEGNWNPSTGNFSNYWGGGTLTGDDFDFTNYQIGDSGINVGWSATNPPGGISSPGSAPDQWSGATGGGTIGGSGDLGTGGWASGGSAWSTLMGESGGLWDYDCATQGPSYNSAGECIACCG